MYDENEKSELTDLDAANNDENANLSGIYGGSSFKDYTYSTYDYSSFYDENYSNSYEKADKEISKIAVEKDADKGADASESGNLNDSFEAFDSLNTVNSFEAFDSLNTVDVFNASEITNNMHNDSNNELNYSDPTVYLDEFLQESVNYDNAIENSVSANHNDREINIPGCIVLSLLTISFLTMLFGGAFSNTVINSISSFAPVIMIVVIGIIALTGVTPSIFLKHNDLYNKEVRTQNYVSEPDKQKLQKYLDIAGKTTFVANGSYCLTGTMRNKRKKSISTKYAVLVIFIFFAICNIFGYLMLDSGIEMLFILNGILLFSGAGIVLIFISTIEPAMRKKSELYSEPVDAVCVEVETRWSKTVTNGHRHKVYKPILYVRYNGNKYILFNDLSSNVCIPYVGQVMKIVMDKSNPSDFEMAGKNENNGELGLGIVFVIIPLILYIYMVILL